ncbi:MAG: serine/threonine-protein phosphatase [Candidatus Obscuribacterales bacterium]|nr:serine/threonine-protein phosphatase [Steroidobacteraceae bacterium]
MPIEHADLSLIGDRDDNQDRVAVAVGEQSTLLIVIDGMGGHSDGSRAADTALKSLLDSFWQTTQPLFDPIGFLHTALSRAHDEVVRMGAALSVDSRPRATTAICLVQEGAAYWAHVGDSRIYLIRQGAAADRSRDHSHVELLLRDGKITEDEMQTHPMRNFVECCLGGDPAIPEMTISGRKLLKSGDIVLLCTDGIWANLQDKDIASFYPPSMPKSDPPTDGDATQPSPNADSKQDKSLRLALEQLGQRAVSASAPYSDNSTAAVMRYLAP